jgi:hypothetical protein
VQGPPAVSQALAKPIDRQRLVKRDTYQSYEQGTGFLSDTPVCFKQGRQGLGPTSTWLDVLPEFGKVRGTSALSPPQIRKASQEIERSGRGAMWL